MSDIQEFLSSYVKRTAEGSIDVQGTHMQFTQDLHAFLQAERSDNEVIAQAVAKVWRDRPNEKSLKMQALLHYTMENLKVDPQNFNTIRDRVHSYVQNHPRLFKIGKGRGGGVSLLPDDNQTATTSSVPVATAPPRSGSTSSNAGSIQPKAS